MGTFTPVRVKASAPSTRAEPESWRDDALCVQVDTDVFFPDKGEGVAEAKFLCGKCSVKAACLSNAMQIEGLGGFQHRHGVWGGLTPTERVALSKTWKFSR